MGIGNSVQSEKKLLCLERSALALLCFLLLGALAGLIGRGRWYDGADWKQMPPRIQTEALLHGHFAISGGPFRHMQDMCWGRDGMQQCWGLGLSLMRAPFDFFAEAVFGLGFPDRILLLFLIISASFGLHWVFKKQGLNRFERILLPLICVFNAPILRMVNYRLLVYEEVVFTGFFFVIFIFSLNEFYVQTAVQSWKKIFLGFLFGFAAWIRPTLFFYGAVFWFAHLFRVKKNRPQSFRHEAFYLSLGFALTIAVLLFCNRVRFGSPLEFGYSTNLSLIPSNDYALRFDTPYSAASFMSKLREFLHDAFFTTATPRGFYFIEAPFNAFEVNVQRYREFPFKPFTVLSLLILLLGWSSFFFKSIQKNYSVKSWSLISIICFGLLAVFYSLSPTIIARYYMDLMPAVVLAGVISYFVLRQYLIRLAPMVLVAAAALAWVPNFTFDFLREPEVTADWKSVSEKMQIWNQGVVLARSAVYEDIQKCPDLNPESVNTSVYATGMSWRFDKDCRVMVSSSHFAKNRKCIRLKVEIPDLSELKNELKNRISFVRVKKNLIFLKSESQEIDENRATLTFCDPSFSMGTSDQLALYSIAWAPREEMKAQNSRFLLKELEVFNR